MHEVGTYLMGSTFESWHFFDLVLLDSLAGFSLQCGQCAGVHPPEGLEVNASVALDAWLSGMTKERAIESHGCMVGVICVYGR